MIATHQLALIFILAGLALIAGSIFLYFRFSHRVIKDESDCMDDDALKWGTIFFVIGGISFFAAGIFMFVYQRS